MKKVLLIIILFDVNGSACKKSTITTSNLFSNFAVSSPTILADGTTLDTASIILNSQATSNGRFVLFSISGTDGPLDTTKFLKIPAIFFNNVLKANFVFESRLTPGKLYISAWPIQDTFDVRNFTLFDSVTLLPSLPELVQLISSNYGIASHYASQVTLTTTIKNFAGNKISLGTPINFGDTLDNGSPAEGQFSYKTNLSDSNSTVTANYSIYTGIQGQNIHIKATTFNPIENKFIVDSLTLTITQ